MDTFWKCQSSQNSPKIVKIDFDNDKKVEEDLPANLPPHEILFSIDHILEQIFSYLNTRDLLTCRLVSYRFLKFAQHPLENQTYLHFTDNFLDTSRRIKSAGRSLTQLTEFLKTSLTASVSQLTSTQKLILFPCTHFTFQSAPRLGDKILQDFLNTNGSNLRQLTVYTASGDHVHENILIDQLWYLLVKQAPQLEHLDLAMAPTVEWQQELPTEIQGSIYQNDNSRSPYSPLYKTDPEFHQISSRVESVQNKSCLKTLEIYGLGWAKTLEFVCQFSPNLQRVIMESDNYVHLLHPVNRIHLLKNFVFVPESDLDECYRFDMETISMDSNLRLLYLEIDYTKALPDLKTNLEFENKVVAMTNRLLEGSKDILECLSLASFTFLAGIKMPSSMPKVEDIEIVDFYESREPNSTIFPRSFAFKETFPKLICVKITFYESSNDVNRFYNYLNCLDFVGEGESIALSLGVKKVILGVDSFPCLKPIIIPTCISERIQKLFPNANIEVEGQ